MIIINNYIITIELILKYNHIIIIINYIHNKLTVIRNKIIIMLDNNNN